MQAAWREAARAQSRSDEESLSAMRQAQRSAELARERAIAEVNQLETSVAEGEASRRQQEAAAEEQRHRAALALRNEQRARALAEQRHAEADRSCATAEALLPPLQTRLGELEEALSRAVADSSDLRVAAEAANQARDQAVTAAQSWEERAHAAVAETVARSKEGTARGGTVAMLHSELGGVKRLLEAERAANAKLSAELVVSAPDASSGPPVLRLAIGHDGRCPILCSC